MKPGLFKFAIIFITALGSFSANASQQFTKAIEESLGPTADQNISVLIASFLPEFHCFLAHEQTEKITHNNLLNTDEKIKQLHKLYRKLTRGLILPDASPNPLARLLAESELLEQAWTKPYPRLYKTMPVVRDFRVCELVLASLSAVSPAFSKLSHGKSTSPAMAIAFKLARYRTGSPDPDFCLSSKAESLVSELVQAVPVPAPDFNSVRTGRELRDLVLIFLTSQFLQINYQLATYCQPPGCNDFFTGIENEMAFKEGKIPMFRAIIKESLRENSTQKDEIFRQWLLRALAVLGAMKSDDRSISQGK